MTNKLKLLTLSALFFITFSCNQDDMRQDSIVPTTENSSLASKVNDNPYEFVGTQHNLFLDQVDAQPNILNLSQITD